MQRPFFWVSQTSSAKCLLVSPFFLDRKLEASDIIRNAGVAMRTSRKEATEGCTVYDSKLSETTNTCLNLENDLRHAPSRGELEILYQPKICSDSLTVQGAEALLRWQHPVYGSISPVHFIPVAEETGLIVSVGRWVFTACLPTNVSVAESAYADPLAFCKCLATPIPDKEFIRGIRSFILEETEINPASLDLEITESVM